jgi:anaerobic selenocysteine-containing dehydrogenase
MRVDRRKARSIKRREFLQLSGAGAVATGAGLEGRPATGKKAGDPKAKEKAARRPYDGPYTGSRLERVAFPLGGLGAGMLCIEGGGARPRRAGPAVEAVRPARHRQRRRRQVLRTAPIPELGVLVPLPLRHRHPDGPQGAARSGGHGLEPLRAG